MKNCISVSCSSNTENEKYSFFDLFRLVCSAFSKMCILVFVLYLQLITYAIPLKFVVVWDLPPALAKT